MKVKGNRFDAAIVGGGPAGCSAAITLAKRGMRVVLFEAKTYPHDKLCGEFLSPECTIMLDRLGLSDALRAKNPVFINTVCLTAPDGTKWETRLPGCAWGLSRKTLDATMAERARGLGVDVREATTVHNIRGSLSQGFDIETRSAGTQAHARLVIAAHGKRSTLDRALRRRFLDRGQPFIALKSHFQGPSLPNRIELHAFRGGYCGMSEFEGGVANVCLLAHESVFKNARGDDSKHIDAFINWMMTQNARLGAWLARAKQIDPRWISIAQVPFVSKRAVVGDVLMAGDAAGLIVPLAGDGIAMALRSGEVAASHGVGFLRGQMSEVALKRKYEGQWRREFAARLRLGRMLQVLMLRPRLLALSLRVIGGVPPIGRFLIRHTRDMNLIRQS